MNSKTSVKQDTKDFDMYVELHRFHQLVNGKKSVEMRVNTKDYCDIKPGVTIAFKGSNQKEWQTKFYDVCGGGYIISNRRRMLCVMALGMRNIYPDAVALDECELEFITSSADYSDHLSEFGVIGIRLGRFGVEKRKSSNVEDQPPGKVSKYAESIYSMSDPNDSEACDDSNYFRKSDEEKQANVTGESGDRIFVENVEDEEEPKNQGSVTRQSSMKFRETVNLPL